MSFSKNWNYPDGRKYKPQTPFNERAIQQEPKKKNKYGNVETVVNEIKFQSKHEARHYQILRQMLKGGYIKDLQLQVKFEIFPGYVDFKGKKIQPINYICDFIVITNNDKELVMDSKGMKTKVFIMKEKMFKYKYKKDIHLIKVDGDIHRIIKESESNG